MNRLMLHSFFIARDTNANFSGLEKIFTNKDEKKILTTSSITWGCNPVFEARFRGIYY